MTLAPLFRITGCVLVAVLASACTTSVPRAAPGTAKVRSDTGSKVTGDLNWSSCHKTFECAKLTVPLDWFESGDQTIDLALIRKKATGANPIGSLLMNPGGPGASGISFLQDLVGSGNVPDELSQRFDLMSWDPRGTGDSAGVACLSAADMTEPEPLPYPPTAAARARVVAKDRAEQERCMAEDGKVIPYVGTRQTVHDLDAIRKAVGDEKLTYLGFSYGTAIGLEYLKDFGHRVRAMVLDGIVLPGVDPVKATRDQMASFEHNLNLFLADCKSDSSCPFGDGDPESALMDFLDSLKGGRRLPASYVLPDDDGNDHVREGTLGYSEAVAGIATALYNQQSWPTLQEGLATASRVDDPDGHTLLALRDMLEGRSPDGTWDHSSEAFTAISCADQSERATTPFGSPARIRAWNKALPVFGAFGAVGLPGCYDWPKAKYPLAPLTTGDLADSPDVVLVNSSNDPATPYAAAKKAKSLLPGSRLVTWEGDDHTSFAGGHACIDDAVVPYLVDGTKPSADTRCKATGN